LFKTRRRQNVDRDFVLITIGALKSRFSRPFRRFFNVRRKFRRRDVFADFLALPRVKTGATGKIERKTRKNRRVLIYFTPIRLGVETGCSAF
jgi:hypothetical protein